MPQKNPKKDIFLVCHLEGLRRKISKNPIPQKQDKLS